MKPIFTNSSNGAAACGGERGERTGRMGGEYKDGNGVTWEYEEIEAGATCSIGIPKNNRGSISGFLKIPRTVVVRGVSISVVEIGNSAFEGCSGLTAVDIPSSVTKIGQRAFQDCSGLTEVAIPYGVTKIGAWAFCGCSGLTAVTIPSSVTKIGDLAFLGCSGLQSIEVESGNKNYCAESGVLFTKDKTTLICYPGGKPEESYTIPSSVTAIGESAFEGCSGLSAMTIPSSVTAIAPWTFFGCSGLSAVTIPSSVTAIAPWTFFGCSGLTAVAIPEGMTAIGEHAFRYCRSLEAVTIPSSVTAIGDYAFSGCSGLIGVIIPSSVTAIGDYAFSGCSGLTGVIIPSGVTEIGDWAFQDCSGLNAVYWLADANCSVDGFAFYGIVSPATLYARQGEKAAIEGTLWAKWYFSMVVEGYVVTFKDGEGNKLGEQLVKPSGTATDPKAPTKTGYTFVEWQLDGAKYEFSTPVTKDITLVAKWKKKEESTPSTPKDPKTAVESVQLAGVRVVRNPMGEALELEGMERAARVEVYSVAGARVHAEALRGEPRVAIDAQGWASGVYMVWVVASDGERTLRVVK